MRAGWLSACIALLMPTPVLAGTGDVGRQLYEQRCAICHGADLRGTGPLAHKSNPPTIDLTALPFRRRLATYPGVIVASVVLRPNGDLIPRVLRENNVHIPPHRWTADDLRAVDAYIRGYLRQHR
ncbi:c-type cytochrome [Sphingomonas sp. CV7422]|uniref:c-type cytochrome n=1 Tax=Sphingomonas sp. CV7422 TaxID=3018036 RepID=UPI0022FE1BB5|nr:cytochrome c [Sphingomonas sp. CV7422]